MTNPETPGIFSHIYIYIYIIYATAIHSSEKNCAHNDIFKFSFYTSPLSRQTNILKLKDIYYYQLGIYIFKRKVAGNISNTNHCYDARYMNDVTPSYQRLTQCQRSLSFCGTKCWNEIPLTVRQTPSLTVFKRRHREHLVGQYGASD